MGALSNRVIELAKAYIGDVETGNNDGAWLNDLAKKSGNPDHWMPGESYCIAGLLMLFDIAEKEIGIELPFSTSLSTRGFYEAAKQAGWTIPAAYNNAFAVGDIAIFSDGSSWKGHAALVTSVTPEGLSTIEFNTSDTNKGDQRNGGGCFAKTRLFKQFPESLTHLWLRGSVKTSRI
jgi:hypothetical protein